MAPIIAVIGIVAFNAFDPEDDYRKKLLDAYKLVEEEGLGKLEPLGRELAYAMYARVTMKADVENFYMRLLKFYKDVADILDKAMTEWPIHKEEVMYLTVSRLWGAFTRFHLNLDYITMVLMGYLQRATVPVFRKDRMTKIMPLVAVKDIATYLVSMEEEQKKLTNRGCIWIFGNIEYAENYTFASLINDVTACTHMLLDYARRVLDPELREVYRGVLVKNPNPVLLDAAIGWRKTLTKLYELGLAEEMDYSPTKAVIITDRAELTVGSAPGHAVHVKISDNDITAIYYDKDESVHKVLISVAEKLGVDVIAHEVGEYTTFSVPADKHYLLFKCILPFATSLDIRIYDQLNQCENWSLLSFEDVCKIQARYNYDTERTEVHLILDAIKTLKLNRP
jgi:hypothetical protein